MRKRRRNVWAGLLLAALAALTVLVWKPLHLGEPWYHWKSLSGWLEVYGPGPGGYKASPEADEALRHIGPKAVPLLLRKLHATKATARGKAVPISGQYLTRMQAPMGLSYKDLLMIWVEKYSKFRFHHIPAPTSWDHWQAYLGFQALGPLGKAAIPDLAKLARNPAGAISLGCVENMKDISIVAQMADNSSSYVAVGDNFFGTWMRATNTFLMDGDIAVRSLAAIGAEGVPSLVELLADPNPKLKARAALALGMVGGDGEPAVPELIKCLTNTEVMVRMLAADALGWIGKRPESTVPALTEALHDQDIGVQCWATYSLGGFRERASNAIPALLADFAVNDYRTKTCAAVALSKISRETTATRVMPELLELLRDPDWRNSTIIMLGQMKDEPDLVIPALADATGDTNKMVQHNAINILGRFGADAKAAVPKLRSLTNAPDPEVAKLANEALKKIEGGK